MAQLHHPFQTREIPQLMRTKIGQPGVARQPVENQILGSAREHRLPAVGQIAQTCGPIDGRADAVALVTQLHFAGMHADTQPDRRQRCALQLQRTRHRIAGTRERDYKAIALALFDRAHAVMGGDDLTHRAIEPRDGGRHLLRLRLPEPRRALRVGQQQRHRSGRKLAHI